jgi:hypothetical protein
MVNGVIVGPNNCIDIDQTGGTTMRAANTALDDVGPPRFESVVLSCPTPFRSDGNVEPAEIAALFTAGTNNNSNFTSSLVNGYVNGPNETAVTAFNAATLNSFFVTTSYIGAVRNSSDTWWSGWTCNSVAATFASGSRNCASAPTN